MEHLTARDIISDMALVGGALDIIGGIVRHVRTADLREAQLAVEALGICLRDLVTEQHGLKTSDRITDMADSLSHPLSRQLKP